VVADRKGLSVAIEGIHHVSFTVTDIDRTVQFYRDLVGLSLRSRTRNSYDGLGTALFGSKWGLDQRMADLEIAVMCLGENTVEFIEYLDPKTQPYHKNPSVAGSGHLAFCVKDIEAVTERLGLNGVEFHSSINTFRETDKPEWKWCYFRDPDGICVELVEVDSE
jgi:catechol 2,3-dioxygenase-like lactoylglutathione lyase family enzyme